MKFKIKDSIDKVIRHFKDTVIYGIDFDQTLNLKNRDFKPRTELVDFLKNPYHKKFYIVTAREGTKSNKKYIEEFCRLYGLKPKDIYFTNQNLKGDLLNSLGVTCFVDDNLDQLNDAKKYDIKSYHPDYFVKNIDSIVPEEEKSRKDILSDLNKVAKESFKETIKNYRVLMKKDLKKSEVYLDNPIGSKKSFGAKKRKKLPFDYGEFSNYINPADKMGWDIIVVPSESSGKKKQKNHDYKIVGIVKVNTNKEEWAEKGEGRKEPPIGNDKLIVSANKKVSKEDKEIINDFFSSLWQFKKPIYF